MRKSRACALKPIPELPYFCSPICSRTLFHLSCSFFHRFCSFWRTSFLAYYFYGMSLICVWKRPPAIRLVSPNFRCQIYAKNMDAGSVNLKIQILKSEKELHRFVKYKSSRPLLFWKTEISRIDTGNAKKKSRLTCTFGWRNFAGWWRSFKPQLWTRWRSGVE